LAASSYVAVIAGVRNTAAGAVNKSQSRNSFPGKHLRRDASNSWQQITTGVDNLL
jgi:hypothetical protein